MTNKRHSSDHQAVAAQIRQVHLQIAMANLPYSYRLFSPPLSPLDNATSQSTSRDSRRDIDRISD